MLINHILVCINLIWHLISYNDLFVIKPNQTKPNAERPFLALFMLCRNDVVLDIIFNP